MNEKRQANLFIFDSVYLITFKSELDKLTMLDKAENVGVSLNELEAISEKIEVIK